MGFFNTLINGYRIMFQEINQKHNDLIPRLFSGTGTGLMMIGSAVMAKQGMKDETKQVIFDCNKAIEEARKAREGDTKVKKTVRIFKAKATKGLKVAKVFHKGIIMEAVGAGCVGAGLGISEHGKHTAIKAAGAIGASFAAYRGAVRDDLGEEADIKYLTGRKVVKRTEKINKKTGEVTQELSYSDDDGIRAKKDPNAFRFWFSKETCPSVWTDNYDFRIAKLQKIEALLSEQYLSTRVHGGALTLNDMRREFGGLEPHKMDVDIGGIYGRVWDDNNKETHKLIKLHYQDDPDFMSGRTDSCWIIFDCDPEPIIGRMRKRNNVETGRY